MVHEGLEALGELGPGGHLTHTAALSELPGAELVGPPAGHPEKSYKAWEFGLCTGCTAPESDLSSEEFSFFLYSEHPRALPLFHLVTFVLSSSRVVTEPPRAQQNTPNV